MLGCDANTKKKKMPHKHIYAQPNGKIRHTYCTDKRHKILNNDARVEMKISVM